MAPDDERADERDETVRTESVRTVERRVGRRRGAAVSGASARDAAEAVERGEPHIGAEDWAVADGVKAVRVRRAPARTSER
jgi:hypothetical protein